MPRSIATNTRVERAELLDFVRPRHSFVLISSYPDRAKVVNLRRTPSCSVLVLSDDFGGPWVQLHGTAEILDMPSPGAEDGLVEYFRCISGEHRDWAEYRRAMRTQGKSLVRIAVTRWGPIATGGFPARLAD